MMRAVPRNLPAKITITAALLIAGGAGGWVAHRLLAAEAANDKDEEHDKAKPESTRVRVVTAALERGSLPITATVVGFIEAQPSDLQTISSRAGGRVQEICVTKGQLVRAGEPLLRFDRGPLEAALLTQRSLLAAAANQRSEFEQVGRARIENELSAAERRAASEQALALSQLERIAPLRDDGLVATRRAGTTIHYRLADPRVARLIGALRDVFCPSPPRTEVPCDR